jgi:hypothetical protein
MNKIDPVHALGRSFVHFCSWTVHALRAAIGRKMYTPCSCTLFMNREFLFTVCSRTVRTFARWEALPIRTQIVLTNWIWSRIRKFGWEYPNQRQCTPFNDQSAKWVQIAGKVRSIQPNLFQWSSESVLLSCLIYSKLKKNENTLLTSFLPSQD